MGRLERSAPGYRCCCQAVRALGFAVEGGGGDPGPLGATTASLVFQSTSASTQSRACWESPVPSGGTAQRSRSCPGSSPERPHSPRVRGAGRRAQAVLQRLPLHPPQQPAHRVPGGQPEEEGQQRVPSVAQVGSAPGQRAWGSRAVPRSGDSEGLAGVLCRVAAAPSFLRSTHESSLGARLVSAVGYSSVPEQETAPLGSVWLVEKAREQQEPGSVSRHKCGETQCSQNCSRERSRAGPSGRRG